MKTHLLGIFAHPDDAELVCGGTLLKAAAAGYTTGLVDLTRGEMGTRGTPEIRAQEAQASAQLLGLSHREALALPDGLFENKPAHQRPIIQAIRRFQPDIVLTNAPEDRHPDHGRAAKLVSDAAFLAGLRKLATYDEEGRDQAPWRPRHTIYTIQDRYLAPSFVVDISDFWEQKLAAIHAYASQFYNPQSNEPQTYISSPEFLEYIQARAQTMGHWIQRRYGEGFILEQPVPLGLPMDML
jgi:bacillithiol biosynthesis deacetylase BshB1